MAPMGSDDVVHMATDGSGAHSRAAGAARLLRSSRGSLRSRLMLGRALCAPVMCLTATAIGVSTDVAFPLR
jgi:hypothetical protein